MSFRHEDNHSTWHAKVGKLRPRVTQRVREEPGQSPGLLPTAPPRFPRQRLGKPESPAHGEGHLGRSEMEAARPGLTTWGS